MPNACIEWQHARTSHGYGVKRLNGKNQYAHRIAWAEANGLIPKGAHVLHSCDNPPCMNPKHLFLGTQKKNNEDRHSKGRSARGVKMNGAKLNDDKVRAIRKDTRSCAKIAADYGVSRSLIGFVKRGKIWGHVV